MPDREHVADRRGFGSITLPTRRGLPCRFECGALFARPGMAKSLDELRATAQDRDTHELAEHGRVFAFPVATPWRRRHILYGRAVAEG